MNYQLLADSEGIPAQGYLFIIVMIFSFLKWLFNSLKKKGTTTEEHSEDLEALYEQYRSEIQQRQTATPPPLEPAPVAQQQAAVPPALPTETGAFASTVSAPLYSAEDIERARVIKESVALTKPPVTAKKRKPRSSNTLSPLKQQLRQKSTLKNAIILQEILSPAKALR